MAVSPLQAQLKQTRVIQLMLLMTIILFGIFVYALQPTNALSKGMNAGIIATAAIAVVVTFNLRGKFLAPAESALHGDPTNFAAVKRWRKWTITSLIVGYAVGMLGFALAMYGARRVEFLVFFLVSVALLLLWTPRLDLPPDSR